MLILSLMQLIEPCYKFSKPEKILKMNVIAIIQARMGSTRLPGKVLEDISGETMLARVLARVTQSSLINSVLVATTEEAIDEAIVDECQRLQTPFFRGSESDVLDRYYQAAKAHDAEAVVRITSDCPLIDPGVIDQVVEVFLSANSDYASNFLERRYPRGLDIEIMKFSTLACAWNMAEEEYQRVHVTPYIYESPETFSLVSVSPDGDYGNYRWTVDVQEDLEFVRAVFSEMGDTNTFTWLDIIKLLERKPELTLINRGIEQKELRAK